MNLDLVFDELLPQPIAHVWRALTDADAIADWLTETTNFRPQLGAHFRMRTESLSPKGWVDAEVLELDPPRRMVWAWSVSDVAPPTTVTFELTPEADGTRLKVTHRGEIDPFVGGLLREGWLRRLESLRTSLD